MSNPNLDDSQIRQKREIEEKVEKQAELLKEAFNEIDKNHDDQIDQNELFNFLESKGKNVDKDTLNKLFKTIDFDQNGTISM